MKKNCRSKRIPGAGVSSRCSFFWASPQPSPSPSGTSSGDDESLAISRETEEITVTRGTINQNLSITGTADAQLNSNLVFQTSGKVSTVGVKVGDVVQQDQVLATLESDDLANSVESAQASVRTAQLKLDDLLAGSTPAEYATAQQAVASAQAQLTKAQNDYDTLIAGGTASDLATAEQGVAAAQAQLATAQAKLDTLNSTPSAADVAASQAAVASAVSAQTAAQNSVNSAQNTVSSAAASLKSDEATYCVADGTPSFCATQATPISSGDAAILNGALSGPDSSKASAVISTNSLYLNAVNSLNSANAALQSAQDNVHSAEAQARRSRRRAERRRHRRR